MSVKLTDDVVATATAYMLVADCGMNAKDAVALYSRWIHSLKADVWSEGWEEGQFYEEALESGRTKEQAQAKDLSDNPYTKEES